MVFKSSRSQASKAFQCYGSLNSHYSVKVKMIMEYTNREGKATEDKCALLEHAAATCRLGMYI